MPKWVFYLSTVFCIWSIPFLFVRINAYFTLVLFLQIYNFICNVLPMYPTLFLSIVFVYICRVIRQYIHCLQVCSVCLHSFIKRLCLLIYVECRLCLLIYVEWDTTLYIHCLPVCSICLHSFIKRLTLFV